MGRIIPGLGYTDVEEGIIPGLGYTKDIDAGGTVDDLLAENVESASEVTAPGIGQEHVLNADNVESASNLSSPVLIEVIGQDDLTADNVESASEVTSPNIEQKHVLVAVNIESASEVSSPAIGQKHALLADDVESASNLSSPVLTDIGAAHVLHPDNVESASEVTAPNVGQVHKLTVVSVESSSEVSSPTLAENLDDLLADNVESASQVSVPSLSIVHNLLADNVESASEITTPAVTDIPAGTVPLFAENVESASEVSAPQLRVISDDATGGWEYPPKPTEKEVRREREKLGIVEPELPVKRVTKATEIKIDYTDTKNIDDVQKEHRKLAQLQFLHEQVIRRGTEKKLREAADKEILTRITLALNALEQRKQAIEEQDIVFVVMTLVA